MNAIMFNRPLSWPLVLVDPIQPFFAPPRVNASWAEHSVVAIAGSAPNVLEHDGRSLHQPHFSCLFVNEFADPRPDAVSPSTIGYELGIEKKTAMRVLGVQRGENFLIGL